MNYGSDHHFHRGRQRDEILSGRKTSNDFNSPHESVWKMIEESRVVKLIIELSELF